MCDPGEHVSNTLKREFIEEALYAPLATPEQIAKEERIKENLAKETVEQKHERIKKEVKEKANLAKETPENRKIRIAAENKAKEDRVANETEAQKHERKETEKALNELFKKGLEVHCSLVLRPSETDFKKFYL
jgi:hypothetical protein